MKISIIIPVKEPEPYLNTLISHILQVLTNTPLEILPQYESGLGHAVECGVSRAKGDIIVVMDADGSHNPQEILHMLPLLSHSDVVIGSRYISSGQNNDSFTRRLVSGVFSTATRRLLGLPIYDTMSGYVCLKRSVLEGYKFPSSYKFLLPLYLTKKYKIKEHPIIFTQRKQGKSKTSFITGFSTLFLLTKLFFQKNKFDLLQLLRLPFYYVFGYCILYLYTMVLKLTPMLSYLVVDNPTLGWMFIILATNFWFFHRKLKEYKQHA